MGVKLKSRKDLEAKVNKDNKRKDLKANVMKRKINNIKIEENPKLIVSLSPFPSSPFVVRPTLS